MVTGVEDDDMHLWFFRAQHLEEFAVAEWCSLCSGVRRQPSGPYGRETAPTPVGSVGDSDTSMASVQSQFSFRPLCWCVKSGSSPLYCSTGLTDVQARQIASRSILLRYVMRLWVQGATHAECAHRLLARAAGDALTAELLPDAGRRRHFRFVYSPCGKRVDMESQMAVFGQYAPFVRRLRDECGMQVALDAPDAERIGIVEDHRDARQCTHRVLVGRWLASGAYTRVGDAERGRGVAYYALPERPFIGTTSMDAELAFLMANVAGVRAGDVVLDPYVGTGSILVAGAVMGAGVLLGADLDMRVLRGIGKVTHRFIPCRENVDGNPPPGEPVADGTCAASRPAMCRNFAAYGIRRSQWPDVVRADMLQPMWAGRPGASAGWCDAIICDPPYGIREGTRRAAASHKRIPSRRQATRRVALDEQLEALFHLASHILIPGGRLVFWLPSLAPFTADDLPACPALRSFGPPSCQRLSGQLQRFLVTMVRTSDAMPSAVDSRDADGRPRAGARVAGHANLAARVFGVSARQEYNPS
ncbi:hypothetical protein CDCA_CDCA08G2539 [Cyanidium caldarium]|uniref:Ribosomal RNA large subunit methyltransferase K/L-like methyltransferase domain-containing protein n=1 Tax=Cyanidium caldarium TaxID=2771 RepID=A0AAV9IW49_CYACA|nr:hypothetical protein CDCA_CDCA08G2539 [Cyanidium caldarium]